VFIDHDYKEVSQAHYSVLQSTELMQPYIDKHLAIINEGRNGCIDKWVMKHHKQQLTTWLKDQNILTRETTDDITINRLAAGSSRQVTS
jgi:hypothetical protein